MLLDCVGFDGVEYLRACAKGRTERAIGARAALRAKVETEVVGRNILGIETVRREGGPAAGVGLYPTHGPSGSLT